jgi:methylphosphotriester-DNA--protein-cysteine methyltransferase
VNATLVLDLGHALFVGPLGSIPEHRASASALLVGMDGPFDLALSGVVHSKRIACVASQTLHALDGHGGRMAVFYFDPGTSLRHPLAEVSVLIAAIEQALSPDRRHDWLGLLSQIHPDEGAASPEPRLVAIARRLIQSSDESLPAAELAAGAQLSVSRLEHLFTAQFGVPLHAFKAWYRFREASKHILRGESMTYAAHAAGFHDSAHFSHAFRDTFGLPPSHVFNASLKGHCWE